MDNPWELGYSGENLYSKLYLAEVNIAPAGKNYHPEDERMPVG